MTSTSKASVVVVVAVMLLLGACGSTASETAAGPQAASDQPFLDDEFATLSGETIDLASLQGQDVVLWFWSPW